jgi:hypothetical protein
MSSLKRHLRGPLIIRRPLRHLAWIALEAAIWGAVMGIAAGALFAATALLFDHTRGTR